MSRAWSAKSLAGKRNHARCGILWGVICFGLLCFATHVFVDCNIAVRDPDHARLAADLKKTCDTSPNRPLVLALATSRTQNALAALLMIDPKDQSGPIVYTFGREATIPMAQRIYLQRILEANPRPKAVLLEFLPADANYTQGGDKVVQAHVLRLKRYSTREAFVLGKYAPTTKWLNWAAIHAGSPLAYRTEMDSYLSSNCNPPSYSGSTWGWRPDSKPVSSERRERGLALSRQGYGPILQNYRIDSEYAQAYRDMMSDLQAHVIPFAVYTLPESPTFRSWHKPGGETTAREFISDLYQEFGGTMCYHTDWLNDEQPYIDSHI